MMFKESKRIFLTVFLCCSVLSYADMNPLHNPGKEFTHVLSVDLMEDRLDQILRKLGRSPVSWTGDAAEAEGKACYLLGDGTTTIEFIELELGSGCVVRKRRRADSATCTPLKRQKANDHVEINGLKLGISRSEVLGILGEPTTKTPTKWTYDFQGQSNDDSGASRFGKGQDYFWQFLIKVSFEGSVVSRLELIPMVQS